jgi:hypothetical protein
MSYVGDFRLGKTFDTKFCTVTTTGAPTTLAGTPVISAYLDNNTTQLTAGITLSVDFDGVTGLNNVRVVATGGNGYATATNYQLVITTGTVGGTSVVGYVVAEFSIEARSALMSTTVDRTVVIDAAGLADANTVKVGPTGSGTAQTAGDIPARLPAALTANGNIKASLVEILTTALTETAGLLAGGFKKFFNVASPVLTCSGRRSDRRQLRAARGTGRRVRLSGHRGGEGRYSGDQGADRQVRIHRGESGGFQRARLEVRHRPGDDRRCVCTVGRAGWCQCVGGRGSRKGRYSGNAGRSGYRSRRDLGGG